MYNSDEIFVVANIARANINLNVAKILSKSLGRDLKISRPSQEISHVCNEDMDDAKDDLLFEIESLRPQIKGTSQRSIEILS